MPTVTGWELQSLHVCLLLLSFFEALVESCSHYMYAYCYWLRAAVTTCMPTVTVFLWGTGWELQSLHVCLLLLSLFEPLVESCSHYMYAYCYCLSLSHWLRAAVTTCMPTVTVFLWGTGWELQSLHVCLLLLSLFESLVEGCSHYMYAYCYCLSLIHLLRAAVTTCMPTVTVFLWGTGWELQSLHVCLLLLSFFDSLVESCSHYMYAYCYCLSLRHWLRAAVTTCMPTVTVSLWVTGWELQSLHVCLL